MLPGNVLLLLPNLILVCVKTLKFSLWQAENGSRLSHPHFHPLEMHDCIRQINYLLDIGNVLFSAIYLY